MGEKLEEQIKCQIVIGLPIDGNNYEDNYRIIYYIVLHLLTNMK